MVQPYLSAGNASAGRAIEPGAWRLQLVSVVLDVPSDKGSGAALSNNRGVESAALGNYAEATQHYDEAIRLNPRLSAAYSNRGNSYVYLGRLHDAIASYLEGLAIEPQSALFHYNFGSILLDAEQYAEAVEHLRRALHNGPHHANVFLNLGLALAGMGSYELLPVSWTVS